MDFDFKGGGGFVVARPRALKQGMPEEYAVKFRLRGRGPVNHLELKFGRRHGSERLAARV